MSKKEKKEKKEKKNKKEQKSVAVQAQEEALLTSEQDSIDILQTNKSTLHDLLAPSGIDATHYDYLEIFSKISRFARTFYLTTIPRQATFPYFLSGIYEFGDINTSVFVTPISESKSQNDLNKQIVELQSERYVAHDRGDINRESILSTKQAEAEALRDQIAAGYNKLFEATIVCTLFAYSKAELDKMSEILSMEASKTQLGLKTAWALQEEGFKSNLPLNNNYITRKHTFDRGSMATVFPFVNADAGMDTGVPIGMNKQTGLPLIFDNFSSTLTNYNMIIFGKSGAGKSVTIKTIMARSAILMGHENLVLDAEGEYVTMAEVLRGINIDISPKSDTVINIFDVETEITKDEITGREKYVLNIENKVEDVTQALLTMARGSTKSEEVNELTKQIIAEIVAEAYAKKGITSDPESLYTTSTGAEISRVKKLMPTISEWYDLLLEKAEDNTNDTYRYHYDYLTKVMRQFCKKFDGQSTYDLLDGSAFININISQLEERFARPLAQQILLTWIWEKYVKKNSEDKTKARSRRVLVDEAWMLLAYPEAVDFLNTMARRARKRNVSLTVVSQKFQDFYENKSCQAVLTSADTKLFLAQDKSEIEYLKEVFKLSEGEADFLITCSRGEGLIKIGYSSAVIAIKPTQREFEFVETNLQKLIEMRRNKGG